MMKDEKKISAWLILEVIGKPQKFLVDTLENLISQMGNEKGVIVKNKNIKEPKRMEESTGVADASGKEVKIEEQKDFYISFAEVEIETDNLLILMALMFKYMPAHVDIISPEVIDITHGDWNDILNELIRKLHGYDEVARVLQVEKAILENKLRSSLSEEKKGAKEVKKSGKPKKK